MYFRSKFIIETDISRYFFVSFLQVFGFLQCDVPTEYVWKSNIRFFSPDDFEVLELGDDYLVFEKAVWELSFPLPKV